MFDRKSLCTIEAAILAGVLCCAGCKKENTALPRPPSTTVTPSTVPPNPSKARKPTQQRTATSMGEVDISGVKLTDNRLELAGISFAIPEGWKRETPQPKSGMIAASRKAQFRLPRADNEPEDVIVAITHFPGMKGMDSANLKRWYGQFVQPDGRPTTEVSTRVDFQIDPVSVTLVDIPGTMLAGGPMVHSGAGKKDYRMLAAIINHPAGPHFFKLVGPAAGVERWKPTAVAFLKSVKVRE